MNKSFNVNRSQNIEFSKEEAEIINEAREFIKDLTGVEVSTNKFIKESVKREINKKNK